MAHELFGTRFLSNREHAWHGLGTVTPDPVKAREALKMMGTYDVRAIPNGIIKIGDFELQPSTKTIVRLPTPDDNRLVEFGTVGAEYVLIRPEEFAQTWDTATRKKVETIGALQEGRQMFITTKLPGFSVKGDDIDTYLLAVNPMDGTGAAQMHITTTRVVCMNTLRAGISAASASYRLIHTGRVLEELGEWLRVIVAQSADRTKAVKEAYTLLAGVKARKADVETITLAAFPNPGKPRANAPADVMAVRMAEWERQVAWAKMRRDAVTTLLEGKGTALDTKATGGTLFGITNAVAELAQYMPTKKTAAADFDTLFGYRGEIIQRAFHAALGIAGDKRAKKAVTV